MDEGNLRVARAIRPSRDTEGQRSARHTGGPGLGERAAVACLFVAISALASAASLPSDPIVVAVKHGDCIKAVALANDRVASGDNEATFLAGRMLDEGICMRKNPVQAADYFTHAVDRGDQSAMLDYAAKLGLGVGTDPSYERAGDICRSAGLDPQRQLSPYSLGYACTLTGIAGRLLRETLPKGAFHAGAIIVDFNPASGEMRIKTTPEVGRGDAPTGSNLRPPLIDAPREINKSWGDAVAAAPKPDGAQLDNRSVELTLDVDMTLEAGRNPARDMQAASGLLNGEFHVVQGNSGGRLN
jgi:hypothetical protein